MNTNLKIMKFSYRLHPIASIILISGMVLTSAGKFSNTLNLRFFGGIDSLLMLVFVNIIALTNLVFYVLLIHFLRVTLDLQLFHMVPEIRERTIKIGIVYFLIYFSWFIYMVFCLENISLSMFFTTWNLYFLSIMITAFFYNKVSVYRSNKYIIPKLLFYFSIIGIIVSHSQNLIKDYFYLVLLFQTGFIGVVIYQMINFTKNFISFNAKDNEVKGFGRFIRRVEDFFENLPDRVLKRKIERSRSSRRKYIELFEITLFGTYHWLIYILYPYIAWIVWGLIIYHEDMNVIISGIPIFSGFYLYSTIGNKDKITFLYMTSGLTRKEFVNTILRTVLRKYFVVFLPLLPFMILYTYIYNVFYGTMEYHVPVILFTFILAGWLFLTWIIWMATLQFADFDKLTCQKKNKLFARSFK